jgi:lysozyme
MISDVIARLKTDEGFGPYVYLDTRGFSTLGYGFCVDRRGGSPIPDSIAQAWLTLVAAQAQSEAANYPWWTNLDDARQNIVTCLIYNLGKPVFDTFTLMQAALAAGNWQEAANELQNSKWYTEVGARGPLYVQILANGNWPSDV